MDNAARISFDALVTQLKNALTDAGADQETAQLIAENCASCERDGTLSHGVFRMAGYLSAFRSNWINASAKPEVTRQAAGFIRVDADCGVAQLALKRAASQIDDALEKAGVAVVAIRNSHHFSALWPDLEPFARRGLVAMTMVNTGAFITLPGGTEKVLGTNPFAFAAPVAGDHPFLVDFATSAISHGDLQLAARENREVPDHTGVDGTGHSTTDAQVILDEGGLLPFGGHKGAALSIMIEVLAAALTGGEFSYRTDLVFQPGVGTRSAPRAGQLLIVIDPQQADFAERVTSLMDALRNSGVDRLPGDRLYRNRQRADKDGIPVTAEIKQYLD